MRPNSFIAWPAEVHGLDERLADAPPGVRCLAASDRHVTLAFLGPVDDATALAAFDQLDTTQLASVELTLGEVVLMGHPQRGTALAALVELGGTELADAIRDHRPALLEAAGARPEDRPPRPHLTVARIDSRASEPERARALEWARQVDLAGLTTTLDRIALYGWTERPSPVRYRVVAERRFTRPHTL